AKSNTVPVLKDQNCLFLDSAGLCFFLDRERHFNTMLMGKTKLSCRTFAAFWLPVWDAHDGSQLNKTLVKVIGFAFRYHGFNPFLGPFLYRCFGNISIIGQNTG